MKNGIILIDKEKDMTSRDVVNIISKKLNTRKVGHTGTLDHLATGLMIICVNKATKLVDMITSHEKTYVAKVKIGVKTDTYDITGKILEEKKCSLKKEELINTLNSFIGKYMQEVPIYSAVKVNGKKLYEYARNNIEVELPKHEVEIKEIELLDFDNDNFSFKVKVSKGTYIRSLINDIGNKLNILMTMEELRRISIENYDVSNSKKVNDINEKDIVLVKDFLDVKKIIVDDKLEKKIRNGVKIENVYNTDKVLFLDKNNNEIALYQENNGFLSVYCMF